MSLKVRSICVFCGSREGSKPEFVEYATALGIEMSRRGIRLVFGGGSVGMMGAISRAVVENGGNAFGVIPNALAPREVPNDPRVEIQFVPDMHTRKAMMADNSDAFIAMPGGLGTLEELFEVATWAQLGIHKKPVAVLNISGYFDLLNLFLDQTRDDGFTPETARSLILSESDPVKLLDLLENSSFTN